jgi:hypothetical protein
MRRAMLLALCAVMLASPARAEEAEPWKKMRVFVPPTPAAKACYVRRFDAKHLAAHPKQRVAEMTLLVRVVGYDENGDKWILDPAGKFERVDYQWAFTVTQRGQKPLKTNGTCLDDKDVPDQKDAFCNVGCDGGGFTLKPVAGSDAVTFRTDGIRISECDAGKNAVYFRPGADDKVVRLEKVKPEQCAALEKSEFIDCPGCPGNPMKP